MTNPVINQAVSFYPFRDYKQQDRCYVCLDFLKNKEVVAHDQDGEKHPIHKDCIRDWFSKMQYADYICPFCKKIVNINTLNTVFSLKEKTIIRLNSIKNNFTQYFNQTLFTIGTLSPLLSPLLYFSDLTISNIALQILSGLSLGFTQISTAPVLLNHPVIRSAIPFFLSLARTDVFFFLSGLTGRLSPLGVISTLGTNIISLWGASYANTLLKDYLVGAISAGLSTIQLGLMNTITATVIGLSSTIFGMEVAFFLNQRRHNNHQ